MTESPRYQLRIQTFVLCFVKNIVTVSQAIPLLALCIYLILSANPPFRAQTIFQEYQSNDKVQYIETRGRNSRICLASSTPKDYTIIGCPTCLEGNHKEKITANEFDRPDSVRRGNVQALKRSPKLRVRSIAIVFNPGMFPDPAQPPESYESVQPNLFPVVL